MESKVNSDEETRLTKPEYEERQREDVGMMLQTVPRVPMAGVKRRWGGRIGGLQESSPEVTSSGVLSPPPHFHAEGGALRAEDLQLWDLDLHRGLQNNNHPGGDGLTATTSILTAGESASPTPTTIEGIPQTRSFSRTCSIERIFFFSQFLFIRDILSIGLYFCLFGFFLINATNISPTSVYDVAVAALIYYSPLPLRTLINRRMTMIKSSRSRRSLFLILFVCVSYFDWIIFLFRYFFNFDFFY